MADMKGLGKLGSSMKGEAEKKKPAPDKVPQGESGHDQGEEGHSTITHHADGSHTSMMHGGAEEHHPDHKHLMAHIGHHLTGGDAHHVMHHDGMEEHHHSVEESGEHHDGELGMGGQETPQDGGGMEESMEEQHPMYGGM